MTLTTLFLLLDTNIQYYKREEKRKGSVYFSIEPLRNNERETEREREREIER